MTALGYAIVGLVLGIYMAATKNHGQFVTHAHILLIGFVVSFVYAVLFKLWLSVEKTKIVLAQYITHQLGTIVLVLSLFCLYGGFIAEPVLAPLLAVSSVLVLVGMVLMKVLFIKQGKAH